MKTRPSDCRGKENSSTNAPNCYKLQSDPKCFLQPMRRIVTNYNLTPNVNIHLNPVRVAAMGLSKQHRLRARSGAVNRPDESVVERRMEALREYRWSSYRAYVGATRVPAWLRCAEALELGGGKAKEQRNNYRRYVENQIREGVVKSPWEELTDRVVLGGTEFLRRVGGALQKAGRLKSAPKGIRKTTGFAEVVAAVERVRRDQWDSFRERHGDRGRDQVLYLARRATPLSLSKLAKAAGLNQHASVAVAIKRYEDDMRRMPAERKMLKEAGELLQITM